MQNWLEYGMNYRVISERIDAMIIRIIAMVILRLIIIVKIVVAFIIVTRNSWTP